MKKANILSASAHSAESVIRSNSASALPLTLEERLHRIEVMGQRVAGYVQFMCQVVNLNNASAEAKERAVAAFYERMVVAEKQLGRIHDELRLE